MGTLVLVRPGLGRRGHERPLERGGPIQSRSHPAVTLPDGSVTLPKIEPRACACAAPAVKARMPAQSRDAPRKTRIILILLGTTTARSKTTEQGGSGRRQRNWTPGRRLHSRRVANPTPTTMAFEAPGRVQKCKLLCLLAGVFLLKLVVVLQLRDHPLVHPTSAWIRRHMPIWPGGWSPVTSASVPASTTSHRSIFIFSPRFCSPRLFTAARLIQIVLGTAAVGFIFVMTREWFGERAAWAAAGFAALTGLFTFYEALILQASIDVFLTSAALLCLTLALRPPSQSFGETGPPSQSFGETGPPSQRFGETGPPSQSFGKGWLQRLALPTTSPSILRSFRQPLPPRTRPWMRSISCAWPPRRAPSCRR